MCYIEKSTTETWIALQEFKWNNGADRAEIEKGECLKRWVRDVISGTVILWGGSAGNVRQKRMIFSNKRIKALEVGKKWLLLQNRANYGSYLFSQVNCILKHMLYL